MHLWNRLSTFIPKHFLQNLKNPLIVKPTIYGRTLGGPVDSWVTFGDQATVFQQHWTNSDTWGCSVSRYWTNSDTWGCSVSRYWTNSDTWGCSVSRSTKEVAVLEKSCIVNYKCGKLSETPRCTIVILRLEEWPKFKTRVPYVLLSALTITPSHQQNMHVFADGHKNMNEKISLIIMFTMHPICVRAPFSKMSSVSPVLLVLTIMQNDRNPCLAIWWMWRFQKEATLRVAYCQNFRGNHC